MKMRYLIPLALAIFLCLPVVVFSFQAPGAQTADIKLVLIFVLFIVVAVLVGFVLFLHWRLADNYKEKKPRSNNRSQRRTTPPTPIQIVAPASASQPQLPQPIPQRRQTASPAQEEIFLE